MSQRKVISTPNAPKAIGPYSQAIQAGSLLFVSGQIPLNPQTGELVHSNDISGQTRQVLDNIKAILAASGLDLANVVKSTIFLTDLNDFAAVNAVYSDYFANDPPARATVQVAALPKGANVEIEVVACG
jgi:2-iminobutanoate/2-iminopropanoate deaminase